MNPFLKLMDQRIDQLFSDHRILNWNPIKKSIFVFAFFIFIKILWILWKGVIYFTPEYHPFIHLPAMLYQLRIELIEIGVAFALIILGFFCIDQRKFYHIAPYFTVQIFGLAQLYDAYMSGIFSASTIVNAACYLFVGLILFNSRIIFSVIVSVSIVSGIIGHLTLQNQLVYAPLFNFENIGQPYYQNSLWLGTMGYFCFPVMFISLYLLNMIIKQWREREMYIAHLVQFDSLTGVYNRRKLTELLLQMDDVQHHAIIMLDLDNFKQVNDRYGHLIGDQVLITVANTIQENIRGTDILGRYGGEEFLMILKNTDEKTARMIAQRCIRALSEIDHRLAKNTTFKVTGSMGIAFIRNDTKVTEALNAADIALYQAKAQGRNRICFAENFAE
ncbi:GGDEF domain-containing protein [Acinetobacter gerneri]|uniref:GGDEF domain-containing protein n=1 Tax=Acinetobacter gerneri TaxID=202952 RepID=UPI0029367477|nr:GGDEF domain-containing protein [Acinetobacter gerneri]MDV2439411.1 GGDEF domain-containing protein [Acinetobacter gerneri]